MPWVDKALKKDGDAVTLALAEGLLVRGALRVYLLPAVGGALSGLGLSLIAMRMITRRRDRSRDRGHAADHRAIAQDFALLGRKWPCRKSGNGICTCVCLTNKVRSCAATI
ncbi:MAG: hypothetical protein Q8L93_13210 [Rhodocyclaceae bacterium]|nr:hypothetical protein [Rhodocyclaceae bacterium]